MSRCVRSLVLISLPFLFAVISSSLGQVLSSNASPSSPSQRLLRPTVPAAFRDRRQTTAASDRPVAANGSTIQWRRTTSPITTTTSSALLATRSTTPNGGISGASGSSSPSLTTRPNTFTGAASSPGSIASPSVLTDSTTLKEASDLGRLRRPRRNVTLPILALLDLSSMENRGSGKGGVGSRQVDSDGDSFDGSSLLKTAQMAVAHVNARQLIPGFHLQLLVNDSKVKKKEKTKQTKQKRIQ